MLPEAGTRLLVVYDFGSVQKLDPVNRAVRRQTDLVGATGQGVGERVGYRSRKDRRIDHEAHLGIQPGRTRIEVERADKDP